ncbi:MAG: hypothetical protein K8W52_23500 [Deltaproteobacteria bacterium]|nr:hypothetical protein [Deltaproteobacteria bacterium]
MARTAHGLAQRGQRVAVRAGVGAGQGGDRQGVLGERAGRLPGGVLGERQICRQAQDRVAVLVGQRAVGRVHRDHLAVVVLPVGVAPARHPTLAKARARALIAGRGDVVIARDVGAEVLHVAEAEDAEAVLERAEQELAAILRRDALAGRDADPARGPALAEHPLELGLRRQAQPRGDQRVGVLG